VALVIVDLDGPILDVAPRYFAAHCLALAETGAESPQRALESYWLAKQRGETVCDDPAYAAAFKRIIERDDLLEMDRLQPGALEALASLPHKTVLSLRTNVVGARRAVLRLGVTAVAQVDFVPHNPEGKVPFARGLGDIRAVIGDTEADADVARALGVPFLGVSCGIREEGRLRREGAVHVADDLAGAVAWLTRSDRP
jgi:phosphoglycolate phosphatase-like HAD superfamily hydrolase